MNVICSIEACNSKVLWICSCSTFFCKDHSTLHSQLNANHLINEIVVDFDSSYTNLLSEYLKTHIESIRNLKAKF